MLCLFHTSLIFFMSDWQNKSNDFHCCCFFCFFFIILTNVKNCSSGNAEIFSTPWRHHEWLTLHWRHDDHGGVSNHQPCGCLLNRLFRRRWKKTSKLHVTGFCAGNSPGPVNSPHKGPVTRKMFPLDDVFMNMATCPSRRSPCSRFGYRGLLLEPWDAPYTVNQRLSYPSGCDRML